MKAGLLSHNFAEKNELNVRGVVVLAQGSYSTNQLSKCALWNKYKLTE